MTTGGHRPGTASVGDLAREAAARGGQRPFVTFYDDATGERTELGHATVHNWVSKSANLLADELGVAPGSTLGVRLRTHWTTVVLLLAAWRCGAAVLLGETAGADAVAVSEDAAGGLADPSRAVAVGAGFGGRLVGDAGGALDFGAEVLACGDEFDDPPVERDAPALVGRLDGDARAERASLTHGDLLGLAAATGEALGLTPRSRPLLRYPVDTLEGLAVLLAALAADASVVLVAGSGGSGAVDDRAVTERCDLVVGPPTGEAPPGVPLRSITVERDASGAVTGVRPTG